MAAPGPCRREPGSSSDLVRLDRVRAALGRQSPDQSNPRRRADLRSIRPDNSLTVFGQTALEHYALGEPTPNTYNGLDYSGVGLRAKLWSTGEWIFSGEATAFIPGARNSSAPAQEGNTGGAAEARLNAGRNFTLGSIPGLNWIPGLGSIPGFLDAEVAYRLRTAGPPDEWHGDLTVGFKFTPKIMLMLQEFTTVSMKTTDPTFPAWRQSVVEASVVYALDDNGRCSSACSRPSGQSRPTASAAGRSPCGEIFDNSHQLRSCTLDRATA